MWQSKTHRLPEKFIFWKSKKKLRLLFTRWRKYMTGQIFLSFATINVSTNDNFCFKIFSFLNHIEIWDLKRIYYYNMNKSSYARNNYTKKCNDHPTWLNFNILLLGVRMKLQIFFYFDNYFHRMSTSTIIHCLLHPYTVMLTSYKFIGLRVTELQSDRVTDT